MEQEEEIITRNYVQVGNYRKEFLVNGQGNPYSNKIWEPKDKVIAFLGIDIILSFKY